MARIDIHIPHPVAAALTIVAALSAIITIDHFTDFRASVTPSGGRASEEVVRDAEGEGLRLRQQQAVLQKREEILRYQLQMLREERRLRGPGISAAIEAEIDRSEQMLLDLIRDQQEAEGKIMLTLKQIWDAQGRATTISKKAGQSAIITLVWPVEPTLDISAGFNDPQYEAFFGMPHKAIDIPADQGTEVLATADGVVEDSSDNGYGFNSVTIRHNGFATLYGHVESFLVEEGQTVHQGQVIALSGGRPGTLGAGHLSTGPHLHFEVIVDGERVDPIGYLPKREWLR